MAVEQIHDNNKYTAVRLPTNIKPVHYQLKLEPDLATFTFKGTVNIEYQTTGHIREIVLHAIELDILDGHVTSSSSSSKLSRVTYSKGTETATLEFADGVFESGTLSLQFKGTLNDRLRGFYWTKFTIDEEAVYAAATQFAATDTRRCFPCWDEPAIKSTFSVSLVVDPILAVKDKKYTQVAISNMPEISRVDRGAGKVEVFFDKSPVMSTYLLAFVVGPFESIETHDGKRPIRVYTTPGKTEQGRYALDVAAKSLTFYEQYFDIPFPLPKMDMIGIPDCSYGAMEHWGLVTYRETCIKVDEANTSTAAKQYVAIVVAHELAHQWFGNLVTMEWWTHLWLNEGFASFMQFLCVDHIFPEYDVWSQFVFNTYSRALDLDSLHSSHPIEVPVNHPNEINEIFDDISYKKGGSILRMLYNYIGDEMFRKGIKDYLTKYAYKNAVTEDLWAALEAASKKPICKFMSGWTSQKGYPWLSVSASSQGDVVKLSLEQSKFSADGALLENDDKARWLMPISVIIGARPTEIASETLFEGKTGEIVVEGAGQSWIKLNPGTIALYRVAYPQELIERLWTAISDQSLPPMDRLGLQDDSFALCQAGKTQTGQLLSLLKAYQGETDYTVWSSIDNCIAKLNILMSNTEYKEKFNAYGRALYSEILKKVTWDSKRGEKHTVAMTRSLVINRMVSFEDTEVIAEAKLRFSAHYNKTSIVPADLRSAVYRAIACHGDEDSFNQLFEIYRKEELQEEQNRVAGSLGYTKNYDRLKRVIAFILSDEVRNQDRLFFIMPIGLVNPSVAWQMLKDNKDFLLEKYEGGHLIQRLIKFATENFVSDEKASEISQFFQDNKFPGAERAIQQSLETIRLNASWLARSLDDIRAFFS